MGQDRATCRKALWADLEDAGLTLKVEDHMQRVPLSQRSGEVIEPMLSDQWFVSTEVMAQRAMDAVESGDINIQPDRFVKTWKDWLKEKQPWCISRQLWWGHRIPVFYPTNKPGSDQYFVARSTDEASLSHAPCGVPILYVSNLVSSVLERLDYYDQILKQQKTYKILKRMSQVRWLRNLWSFCFLLYAGQQLFIIPSSERPHVTPRQGSNDFLFGKDSFMEARTDRLSVTRWLGASLGLACVFLFGGWWGWFMDGDRWRYN
eukprot:symbB.v1.2.001882.t1/scaffold79.1/size344139/13